MGDSKRRGRLGEVASRKRLGDLEIRRQGDLENMYGGLKRSGV
jgi:hypothetical protein